MVIFHSYVSLPEGNCNFRNWRISRASESRPVRALSFAQAVATANTNKRASRAPRISSQNWTFQPHVAWNPNLPIHQSQNWDGKLTRNHVVLMVESRGSMQGSQEFLRPYPCRSEEHTSELQSRQYLVCRLLLEKKKKKRQQHKTKPHQTITY